jgi:TM2 domain-containing membrane protein YozV
MLSNDDVRTLRAEIQADTAAGRYEEAQAKVRLLTAAGQELYATAPEPSPAGPPAIDGAGAGADHPRLQKNPGLAAALSFAVCGLGQIYNGEPLRGIVLLVLFVVPFVAFWTLGANLTIGLLVPLGLWILGIVDAYRTAERMNRETTGPLGSPSS